MFHRRLMTQLSLFVFLAYSTFCAGLNSPCEYGYPVITDLQPEDCGDLYYIPKNETELTKCLPQCAERQGFEDVCSETKPCAPGLICNSHKCILDEDSCLKYNHLPKEQKPIWTPKCLPDGTYCPKQFKGETDNGRWFCYDAVGKRIFGQQWSDKAENMTCACSRYRSKIERAGRTGVTLHCDSEGNYEPLQCDSGLCWCVESQTGKVMESVVPESMVTFLPCYKKADMGDQYVRVCESQSFAQDTVLKGLKIHGTNQASFAFTLCDYDGSYGKIMIEKGIAYCILRDKSKAGSWASEVTSNIVETMNCNCARDTYLYKEVNLPQTLLCEANGNYKIVQEIDGGKSFCVDSDGFATSQIEDKLIPVEDCPKV